jgi:hypothetical protein
VEDNFTPRPGTLLSELEAKSILSEFLSRYRREPNGVPSNLPTACTLDGVERKSVLDSQQFLSHQELYVLFEYPRQLFKSSARDIATFVKSKEQWEDYDLCIFSKGLSWCVGVTHNDKIILVDNGGEMMGTQR